jgi:hypothetical protein
LQENAYDTGRTLQIPHPDFKLQPAWRLGRSNFSARTTQEEKDRHEVAGGGKPLQFISEKLGDLSGLDFLNSHPERDLTDLKNKLYELDAVNARNLSAKARKDWVDWTGSIERVFETAEEALANALRFFTQTNFLLVSMLGKDAKEQERLSQMRWSEAERRVIFRAVK